MVKQDRLQINSINLTPPTNWKKVANCFIVLLLITFTSCSTKDTAPDLIITNATLWSHQGLPDDANTIVIDDGKIKEIGSALVADLVDDETKVIDAKGAFVMPGFIEGHGHFSGLGKSLQNLNLLKTTSWDDILTMVNEKVSETPPGQWIEGRGWHQEKWTSTPDENYHGYPSHEALSDISQDHPLILYHASGHALFANAKAMEFAGVSRETADPVGGAIIRDENGDAIGVFEERAMNLVYAAYKDYLDGLPREIKDEKWYESIALAEAECLQKGITSFQDAGSKIWEIERYTEMADKGALDLRLWAMVRQSSAEMEPELGRLKVIDAGNGFFTCNAIKSEIDGALGAFGAWLIEPYSDKDGFHGQNTTDIKEVKAIADLAIKHDMQYCVHAIGDRANRVIVDLYESMLSKSEDGNDRRWRIEHAQHLDPVDIPRFASNGIIASMQGIHCTSDAPFVVSRLGEERSARGAYAWRSLLDADVLIANGTDAPVEDVDPLPSLYASVTRQRADSGLKFFPEQSMTRHEALSSYTYANAYAAFEDESKGSLEVGKYADIVIFDTNLLTCATENILKAKVLYSVVDGKVRYEKG